MLKLKLQYFGHLMRRTDSLEKTLMLRKTEDKGRGRQRTRWLDTSPIQWTFEQTQWGLSKLREIVKDKEAWGAVVHEVAKNGT